MAIPVIDVAGLFDGTNVLCISKEIHKACLEYGFFYVVNSGISGEFQAKVLDTMRQFFSLPVERKRMIKKKENNWRGYFNLLGEFTDGKRDWKEGIYYFPNFESSKPGSAEAELGGENLWPDEDLPEFKRVFTEYFQKATCLGHQLMSAISLALGLEADFFTKKYTGKPFSTFGLFHYPPYNPSSTEDGDVFGVGEHTDYGNLILLLQDNVGGLQIQTEDGIWIDVPPIPGSMVINIGDMLELWTSGAYKSTRHRVKTSMKHRFSVALFFDPSLQCVISPIPLDETTIPRSKTQAKLSQHPVYFGDYALMKYTKNFKQSAN